MLCLSLLSCCIQNKRTLNYLYGWQGVWHCYFEKGCRKKVWTRQSRKVNKIWSIHCSWHSRCRNYFCCFSLAIALISLWSLVPFLQISLKSCELKTAPTIPFGIVACTFCDNLFRNGCIFFVNARTEGRIRSLRSDKRDANKNVSEKHPVTCAVVGAEERRPHPI